MFKNLSTQALGLSGGTNETIELALSYGFKGIDLDVVDFHRQVKSRGLETSRRLLDSAKLRLGSFDLPINLEAFDDDYAVQLAALPDLAKLAASLGCTRCVTQIAPASDLRPYHQNFEFHRRRLSEIATILEQHGVRLAVGFQSPGILRRDKSFEFVHQLDPLIMLLGLVGKRNVGLCIDLWQLHLGGYGPEIVARWSNEQIVLVRLADAPTGLEAATCSDASRLLPGETGVIDAASFLTAIAEKGYDGPVTPFPHPSQFAGQRRDQVAKRAGEALERIWKLAGLSNSGKLATAAK